MSSGNITPELCEALSKLTRDEWQRVKACMDDAFKEVFDKVWDEAARNAPETCGASGAVLYGEYARREANALRWRR